MATEYKYSQNIDFWAWLFTHAQPPNALKKLIHASRERKFRRSPERRFRLTSQYHYYQHDGPQAKSKQPTRTPFTEVNASYPYDKIQGSTHVRILELLPGDDQSPLEGRFVIEPLENIPPFSALSYHWGSHEVADTIWFGSNALQITKNLSEMLRRLRCPKDKKRFWIDAICIAQHLDAERHAQVRIMDQIYSQATTVIIWLGEEDGETANAFSIIKDAYGAYLECQRRHGHDFNFTNLQDSGFPSTHDRRWPALRSLLFRKWFCRTWILQECRLARYAVVRCGSLSCDWETLAQVALAMHTTQAYQACKVLSVAWASGIAQISGKYSGDMDCSLLGLLRVSLVFGATDPRDKIYGLLGIASDANDFKPLVDYRKPVATVYGELVEMCLQQGRLDFLNFGSESAFKDQQDLPSWCPDFSTDAQSTQLPLSNMPADSLRIWNHPLPTLSADRKVLHLCCITKHTVKTIGCHLPFGCKSEDVIDFRLRIEQWRYIATRRKRHPATGLDSSEAFALTIASMHHWVPTANFASATEVYLANKFHAREILDSIESTREPLDQRRLEIFRYRKFVYISCLQRSFFITDDGHPGLGPYFLRPGDKIIEVDGANAPLAVRQLEGGRYTFLGECFMHGAKRTDPSNLSGVHEIQVI